MRNDPVTQRSKRMSWLLRHGAVEAGVEIDSAGWVEIDVVLKCLNLTREQLDEVVRLNNKSRFQVEGTHIRASQGHSMVDVAISLEEMESSWEEFLGDGSLWHGTFAAVLESIAQDGLKPGARTHVHLAESKDSPVGKRGSVDVLLEVSTAKLRACGERIFRSPNGVILVRRVPPNCIVSVSALTARTARIEAELQALFRPESAN